MKKTKKMMMVLLTVSMVAMLLSGCKKKDLIVDESKDSSAQASVELPTVTEEPVVSEAPEESKEAEVTSEPTKEPESMEGATATPEVTEVPEATAEPTEVPTEAPTVKPTEAPTPKPTAVPTAVPTEAPTPVPTPKPTERPVYDPPTPTEAPTAPPAQSHTHSFDGGTVTTQPTCGRAGVKTYTCSCGETKTEAIAATGNHANTYEDWMYYPSCSKGGYVNVVCSDCGAWISGGDVPPTAHEYEATLVYAGDCCTPATYSNTCKVCGAPGEATYGEKNPNVHDWVTDSGEEWDDEKQQWVVVTGTYCSDCYIPKP